MRRIKNQNGHALISVALYCVVVAVILASVLPGSGSVAIKNMDESFLKHNAFLIDNALSLWTASHGGKYPPDLATLKLLNIIPQQLTLDNFVYEVSADFRLYKLTVNLPSGQTFVSPNSKM